jgi:hypothetical protein
VPISAPPNRKSGPPIITGDITIGAFDNEADLNTIDADLTGLSVLGRAPNTDGPMAAITASGANQHLVSNAAGTSLEWASTLSNQFDDTVSGTLDPYLLPANAKSGDSLVWVITGNTTLNRIRMSDDSIPPDGFVLYLSLRDQSGGTAPGHTLTLVDTGAVTVNGSIRTPGQVQGTSPGPSYVMQSEEEGCTLICRQGNWRLVGGTAAQAIEGDITVAAGNGSTRTAAITAGVIVNADINASAAIALSKLATQAANTVVANATGSTAVPTAVSVGTNTVLGRQGSNIVAAQVATAQVADNAITDAKIRDSAALSVIGRSANTTGDPADISGSASSDAVLRISGTTLGFGTVATAGIANDAVTYAKIQNVVNNNRFLGRISGAGGDVEELTGTQATTLIDTFTSALKGLAPASGGGTTNFLRADGTWTTPVAGANATEINNSTATGNLGTIDISALTCGGTYRVSASSANFSIEGFTAKTAGFWFMFEVEDTDLCVLFHEDATATATNRLDLPGSIDVSAIKPRGIFFYTGSRWRYVSSANPCVLGSGSDLVQVTQGGGNVVNITTSAGDVNISPGGTGSVVMTSAASIGVQVTAPSMLIESSGGGGFLRFVESSTSVPAVTAGQGMYWVKDSSPPQPMYTDENEDDWPLLGQGVAGMNSLFTVTNSTTALSLTDSFVIPSDSCQVGTTYKLTSHFKFIRGATATALTLRAGGFVNGTERGTTGNVSTKTAAAAYLAEVTGILTIASIGVGGTAFLSVRCNNTYNASGAAGSDAYLDGTNGGAAIATFAFNTTTSNSIELRAQMQAAVADCSLVREGGFVERVRY